MSRESAFIELMRATATEQAARGLLDDAAVLEVGGTTLVLTKDMLVEGIHYLPDDPPADVAWKLVAVNLSDLAAKGARPLAALLGFTLGDEAWDRAFADGLRTALEAFALPLVGGDTVSAEGPRMLSLTCIGEAVGPVPSRAGAAARDELWVSGSIGDAGAGLAILRREIAGDEALVRRYRAPRPRLEAGQALATIVSAMMDVSDGLLIDASRLGHASGLGVTIELDRIPLSEAFISALGDRRGARVTASTAGDDYELLFAAAPDARLDILRLADILGLPLTRIGRLEPGAGLRLTQAGDQITLPGHLGYEH